MNILNKSPPLRRLFEAALQCCIVVKKSINFDLISRTIQNRSILRAALRLCSILSPLLISLYSQSAYAGLKEEYNLKGAFLYNILQFTQFPSGEYSPEKSGGVKLCVYGGKESDGIFKALSEKSIGTLPLRVIYDSDVSIQKCHVVFFLASGGDSYKAILQSTAGSGILTIGESEDFCDNGGMVNFFMEDNKLRFEVSVEKAKNEKIELSSKLLRLAKIYGE